MESILLTFHSFSIISETLGFLEATIMCQFRSQGAMVVPTEEDLPKSFSDEYLLSFLYLQFQSFHLILSAHDHM